MKYFKVKIVSKLCVAFTSIMMIGGMFSLSFAGTENKSQDSHHEEHHVHKHHFGVFSGMASNLDGKHSDFALGVDYEHRLPFSHNRFGVGLFGEYVSADHSETILGAGLLFHPGKGFKFMAAPSAVFAEEAGHGEVAETETTKTFLFRVGVGKDFHVSQFSITPTLNLDFVDGHKVLVYGLTFGKGF